MHWHDFPETKLLTRIFMMGQFETLTSFSGEDCTRHTLMYLREVVVMNLSSTPICSWYMQSAMESERGARTCRRGASIKATY